MNKDIIVIEDDQKDRELACKVLLEAQYTPVEAESGDQAFRLIERRPWTWVPYACFIDLVLPGTSGFEVIRRLAARYSDKKVPLIVISKLKTQNDFTEAELAGAHSYIIKPCDPSKIVSSIDFTLNIIKERELNKRSSGMIHVFD